MPKFGKRSKKKRETLHPKLQKIVDEAIKHVDFSILEGVRTVERQKELVATGKSKTMKSKHLPIKSGIYKGKSRAMDAMKYPIDWDNWQRNYLFAGYILGVANSLGIKLRLGADWDGDFTTKDQSFHDLPHFELDPSEK